MSDIMQFESLLELQQILPDDEIKKELGLIDYKLGDIDLENNYKYAKRIYVQDFGAKGDGVKNDSSAIRKAITALKNSPRGSILEFEKNKTYYISSGKYALDLKNIKNVKIEGNGALILVKPIMSLCRFSNCKNVSITGITFDYKTKPYAIADVVDVYDDGRIRLKSNRSLNIRGTYKQPVPDYFGLVDRPDSRYHVGITTYKVYNKDLYLYDVKCNSMFADRDKRIKMMKENKYKFIIPMPNVGQVIEHAINFENNTNISFVNCTVRCAAKHMFSVTGNEGIVVFDNLKVVSDSNEEMPIIGWGDGFYCKDNRAKIIWHKCNVKALCDDVLNIGVSFLHVQSISDKVVSLYWQEKGAPYHYAKVGDEITFINTNTGEYLGKSKIISIHQYETYIDVELLDNLILKKLDSFCKGYIKELSSINSVIKNCNFHGTFRLRSPIYITKSRLHITRMWMNKETSFFGPIADDILFSNCVLDFDDKKYKYIHIDVNNNWKKASNPYYARHIVFYNCKMRTNAVEMGNAEKKFSSVRFINCSN